MTSKHPKEPKDRRKWGRRDFIKAALASGGLTASGFLLYQQWEATRRPDKSPRVNTQSCPVFTAKISSYSADIRSNILSGFSELGILPDFLKGKRILLKPNYIETQEGANHINTHSTVIGAAIDAFLTLGAASIVVAEGSGNCRDSFLVLEEAGLVEVLNTYKVPFVDFNYSDTFAMANGGRFSGLPLFILPKEVREADIIVSMAKLKTHHWVGATASMKNLFGVLPGSFYGWPKNVLHYTGIERCILDLNATIRPHLAIVDGIIGMEGDGPIMGKPKHVGVLVMGRNPASVDATCVRIMGIDPEKIGYLAAAPSIIGPIDEAYIPQRGERIEAVRTNFQLIESIPAFKRLMET